MSTKKPPLETEDVTIWGVHSHKGKLVTPGTKITVTSVQAAFLKAHGVLDKPKQETDNV